MKITLSLIILLVFSGLFQVCQAKESVLLFHVKNPAQKFAYAGKMHWNHRSQHWDRVIVVYNNAPDPDQSHPVSRYVSQLKYPAANEPHQYNLHYKVFHKRGNCNGRTPLSEGKQWRINFDHHPLGAYADADLRADWNCPKWHMGSNLLDIVAAPQAYNGKALRLHYPRGFYGCRDNKKCANWKPQIGGSFNQLTYSYQLKLPKGFDFVIGGKLPGIGGGIANTGGNKPNGTDGWSVRTMWDRHGKLVQYVYHPDQPRQFGEAFEWAMSKPLELGKWHSLKTMVRLNTPGKRDGVIKTWLDGELVFYKKDFRFRDTKKLKIDRFLFASFYGGSDPSWAPERDQYAFFDEFVLKVDK